MDLQDMLVKLAPYGVTCRTIDENLVVSLKFDENWSVIKPENDKVECKFHRGQYYYVAKLVDNGVDYIFNAIDETISYNETLAKKLVFFQKKVDELQQLVANHTLEELEGLRFEFPIKKKKSTSKKKNDVKVETAVKPTQKTTGDRKSKKTNKKTPQTPKKEENPDAGMDDFIKSFGTIG